MNNQCCKNYQKKKACKDCPVLAELRSIHKDIKRKEVRAYIIVYKKQKENAPTHA